VLRRYRSAIVAGVVIFGGVLLLQYNHEWRWWSAVRGPAPAPSDWQRYPPRAGFFTALWPGNPDPQKLPALAGPDGKPVESVGYQLVRNDIPAVFGAFTYPAPQVRVNVGELLTTISEGVAAESGGTITDRTPIRLGEVPGLEFRFEKSIQGQDAVQTSRVFFSGKRVYLAFVLTAKRRAGAEYVRKFLDSFEILP
jgi:hypothetical protein